MQPAEMGCIPHSRIALWGGERRKLHDQKPESAAQDTSGRDAVEILDHCRPECIGQIRNITLVNTQGFYSTVANQPDASANRGNGGRGPILWWGRAAHWQFADGVCSVFDSEQKHTEEELVMSFRVLEKEAA